MYRLVGEAHNRLDYHTGIVLSLRRTAGVLGFESCIGSQTGPEQVTLTVEVLAEHSQFGVI